MKRSARATQKRIPAQRTRERERERLRRYVAGLQTSFGTGIEEHSLNPEPSEKRIYLSLCFPSYYSIAIYRERERERERERVKSEEIVVKNWASGFSISGVQFRNSGRFDCWVRES